MPFQRAMIEAFRTVTTSAGQPGAVSLVHCMAGKDRTGVAVALLQRLLGVDHEAIVEEYLKTNNCDFDRRLEREAGSAERHWVSSLTTETMHVVLSVDAEFLQASFTAIDGADGGWDGYVRDVLQLDAAAVSALREAILDSAPGDQRALNPTV